MCGKVKKFYDRIVAYARAHISVPMTISVIGLLFLAVLILQSYVKNQYFDYLVRQTRNTEQIAIEASSMNTNSIMKGFISTACSIAIDGDLRDVTENAMESREDSASRAMLALNTELRAYSRYTSDIVAITVVTEEGLLMEYGRYWNKGGYSDLWDSDNMETLTELYDRVIELITTDQQMRYAVSTTPSTHPSISDLRFFHIAVPLVGGKSDWNGVGTVLVISFNMERILETSLLLNENASTPAESYLIDANGVIISHNNSSYIGMELTAYQALTPENEDISVQLDYFGWKSYITLDVAGMRKEVDGMYRNSIFLYMALLMICGIIWQYSNRRMLHPVWEIRDAMQQIQLDRNMPKVEVNGTHEIWQLAEHYNHMVDKLDEQKNEIQRYYEERTLSIEQRNQAEREALESQINAHFLCNTLTAINYDAMDNGDYEVADLLKKLSGILSYTFSRRLISVTLGEEIQWVEQYLCLQKFRLMEVFDYEICFPAEYGEWPCCRLFLQPFVENSILHGFEGKENGGRIRIEGRTDGNRFLLTVKDNGCGMEPEIQGVIESILEENRSLSLNGAGIGIQNAVTRLRMYYGENLKIKLWTVKGEGTAFMFWLPIPKNPVRV
ncbi:MAG: histidine kinase [Lachnospiraceae bacterium]|nr:histidine kinase [Lachnospiraceae bacterium]